MLSGCCIESWKGNFHVGFLRNSKLLTVSSIVSSMITLRRKRLYLAKAGQEECLLPGQQIGSRREKGTRSFLVARLNNGALPIAYIKRNVA